MVELTRHIRRSATVTETFAAVTPRMLKAAETKSEGGALVTIGAADGADSASPSSSAVSVVSGLKTRKKEVGFQVLAGAAGKLKPSLEAGAVGGILGFASCAPTACFEIYTAWKESDEKLAAEKQERILEAAKKVVNECGPAGIKYAMDLNGYYGGVPRLPLLALASDAKMEIDRLMSNIRN